MLDNGDDFQDMLKELRDISPNRTRAECKLLLRRIKDVQTASQVTVWVRCACRYDVADKLRAHVHSFEFFKYISCANVFSNQQAALGCFNN